jgi:hypothetical protein
MEPLSFERDSQNTFHLRDGPGPAGTSSATQFRAVVSFVLLCCQLRILIIAVLANGLTLINLSFYWQLVFKAQ